MTHLALLLASLVLAGCLVGPDYRRPEYPVPGTFRSEDVIPYTAAGSFGDLEWWQIFEDERLVDLIHTALVENYDVRIAVARIIDARAQLVAARSFLWPTSALAPPRATPGSWDHRGSSIPS
ncbi:MAG: hypothetical protein ACREKS_07635 [Candidatus Rokuibacteriota bacterium]